MCLGLCECCEFPEMYKFYSLEFTPRFEFRTFGLGGKRLVVARLHTYSSRLLSGQK